MYVCFNVPPYYFDQRVYQLQFSGKVFYMQNHVTCKERYFYFFLSCLYLFHSLHLSYFSSYDCRVYFEQSGKSEQACLVPGFNGNASQFLPFSMMLHELLLTIAFNMLRSAPHTQTLQHYYNRVMLDFVKGLCYVTYYINRVKDRNHMIL